MNCLACKTALNEDMKDFCSLDCETSYYDAMQQYNMEVAPVTETPIKSDLEKSGFKNYGEFLSSTKLLKN